MNKSKKGDEMREHMYAFIVAYLAQEGRAPTLREISTACGMNSRGHTLYHLNILEREGRIVRPSHIHRAIRLQEVSEA